MDALEWPEQARGAWMTGDRSNHNDRRALSLSLAVMSRRARMRASNVFTRILRYASYLPGARGMRRRCVGA